LAVLAQTFGMAFLVIKWLGVAYLTWLAWTLWRANATCTSLAAKSEGGFVASFLAGLTVTLGNPKTMIFYLAITPTLVDLRSIMLPDYLALTLVTAIVLIVVLVPYLALAAKARLILKSPRMLKGLNRVAAAFMGGAAVAIASRAP
jgi:threonine/homoserine/homoserine lactone efflux protein